MRIHNAIDTTIKHITEIQNDLSKKQTRNMQNMIIYG